MTRVEHTQHNGRRHLRPVTAELPIWEFLGPGLTQAMVEFLIAVESYKTDKAASARP